MGDKSNYIKKFVMFLEAQLIKLFTLGLLLITTSLIFVNFFEVNAVILDCDIVPFEDSNLKDIVRNYLSKPNGDITVGDMKLLTGTFDASGKNITSLKGLEYAINVNRLHLQNNKIRDLKPLLNMNNLVTLNLANNEISDINQLVNLSKLIYLDLSYNEIVNIEPLNNMPKLLY